MNDTTGGASAIPTSITTPNEVETRLGKLRFFDGLPDEATVKAVYDQLDFQRGVQAFLTAMPAASFFAVRAAVRKFGPDNGTVLLSESLLDSNTLVLVANAETIYNFAWLDTRDGPVVIEVPPHVLGFINDSWARYVADVGNAGQDKGQGGKYLLVPPGYTGSVPDGYFVASSRTFGNLLTLRGFVPGGDPRPAAEAVKKQLRVYPLARASNPPPTHFADISGVPLNTVFPNDPSYFDGVAQVVEEEPLEAIDLEVRGQLAAIGIQKGKAFVPDQRMQRILAEAVAVGNAIGRAEAFDPRDPSAQNYPDSAWNAAWIPDYQFAPGGVLNLESREAFYYLAWGVTPAMSKPAIGIGSQYAMACRDSAGRYLDGAKNYRLHLPPNIPAKDFWSVLVYDPQTRSMLQTDQPFPRVSSQMADLVVNPDGSVDVYFGPNPPAGKKANWVRTIPGKAWFAGLRLYGPLEPWFDKSWRPGEIEPLS